MKPTWFWVLVHLLLLLLLLCNVAFVVGKHNGHVNDVGQIHIGRGGAAAGRRSGLAELQHCHPVGVLENRVFLCSPW